ncbi:MAG: 2-oxo acid dehydrogenase subunit E2 [Christensenellales bacterium]|jgi:hypothetical protein
MAEKRRRRFGDRRDGRRIRSFGIMNRVGIYIMPNRTGASNYLTDSFDITNVEKFIHQKREQGLKRLGVLHLILAGYVRAVSQRPGINRFISGQEVYARNDIQVMMTIKKEMSLNAEETCIKMYFDPASTVEDIYNQFEKQLEEGRAEEETSFDNVAKIFNHIPGLLLKFAVFILKLMDYFDLLPKSLLHISPFHGSMFITSMGSLGIPPVYHHLYDLGNVPFFIAYGSKQRRTVINHDGEPEMRKFVDFVFTCDERICDGHYYASALKLFKRYLKEPEMLDVPPKRVVEDID